jgi:hypothetical protein
MIFFFDYLHYGGLAWKLPKKIPEWRHQTQLQLQPQMPSQL